MTVEELKNINTSEILERLRQGNLSILKTLGAHKLLYEMRLAGAACDMLATVICLSKDDNTLRHRARNIINFVCPSKANGEYSKADNAIVIGFNHPSLGDAFRVLSEGFEAYPDRDFLFPVNLPWYECLVPTMPKLSRMKIRLVPMITPSTESKLNKLFKDESTKLDEVRYLKNMLERNYMRVSSGFCRENGVIFLAPSATRQEKIIGEHIHPTMTLLGHVIFRKNDVKATFQPLAIVPPPKHSRGMNLFKQYNMCPCDPFDSDEAKELTARGREFDLLFLKRLEHEYNSAVETM